MNASDRPTRLTAVALAAGVGLLLASTVFAQSTDRDEPPGPASPDNQAATETPPAANTDSAAANPPVKPPAKDKKRGDVFQPSEEISEDFAVSFPVDI